jgi:hypothetical protein
MPSLSGQDSWAKITSPESKISAEACNLTKKVNKAEEITSLSTNIVSIPKPYKTMYRF